MIAAVNLVIVADMGQRSVAAGAGRRAGHIESRDVKTVRIGPAIAAPARVATHERSLP